MTSAIKIPASRAALWAMLRVGWSNIASFVIFALLIRLLSVSAFGTYALAASYLEIVRVLGGLGLGDSLARERDVDSELASSAFWAGLLGSTTIALLMLATAPVFARFMHAPLLVPVLSCLAILPVLESLSTVHWALKLRDFGHKAVTIRTVIATLLAGGIAVGLALAGAGVWSLVAQAIVSELVSAAFAWIYTGWRPRFRLDVQRLKPLLSFGGGMVLTQLIWSCLARVPDFFIGRTIGPAGVGAYRIAWRIIELIGQTVLAPISGVVVIALAKLQEDRVAFENAYARAVSLAATGVMPMVTGFGAVASEAMPLLFGAKAAGSVVLAQIIAFSAPPFVMNYFLSPALSAKRKSYVISKIAIVQFVSTVAISMVAVRYGLVALTVAYVGRAYLTLPYLQYMVWRHADVPARRTIEQVVPPLVSTAAMALLVTALRPLLVAGGLPPVARLIVLVPVGAATYAGVLVLAFPSVPKSLWVFGQSLFPKLATRSQTAG